MAQTKPPVGVPAAYNQRRFKYVKLTMDTAAGWDENCWNWEPSDDLYISNVQVGIFPIGVIEDCEAGFQFGRISGIIDPAVGGEETHGVFFTHWKWFLTASLNEDMTQDRQFVPPLYIPQLRPIYVSMYRQIIKGTMDIHANFIIEYWTKP